MLSGDLIFLYRGAVKTADPLDALEAAVGEGLGLVTAMQGQLPPGLPARERDQALAPAFDVLIQLLPVLKALGNPEAALQVCDRSCPSAPHQVVS